MDLRDVSAGTERAPTDRGAGDRVTGERDLGPVPPGGRAQRLDVRVQVRTEVVIGQVDEPDDLVEPLVPVQDEDRDHRADPRAQQDAPPGRAPHRLRRQLRRPVGVDRPERVDPRVPLGVLLLAQQQHVVTGGAVVLGHARGRDVGPRTLQEPPVPQQDARHRMLDERARPLGVRHPCGAASVRVARVGKGLDLRRLQPAGLRGESQADHAERGGGPGTVLQDLDAQHPVVGLPDPERLSLSRTVEVHPYRIPVRPAPVAAASRASYRVAMPARKEILEVAGREVTVSNPDKVFFPKTGHTKLDLVTYYLAVAEGALRGVAGRPMALKRYVNGAEGEFFFQKRAPSSRPDWIETVELSFPSGRTAEEIVVRDAAQLAWIVNLGCIDLNPHPVRADDLDHPDELRVDLDPVPGHRVAADPRRRDGHEGGARGLRARRLAEDVGLARDPRLRAARTTLDVPRGAPGGARAGARGRTPRAGHRDEPVVEGGASRRVPRLQPEREGPHRRVAVLGPPDTGRARLDAAAVGRGSRVRGRGVHDRHRAGARRRARRSVRGHRRGGGVAGPTARARGAARGGRVRRRAVAAAVREAGGRAGPRAAVQAPARHAGEGGHRAAARAREEDRTDRPPADEGAADRDRARGDRARGDAGAGAVEGAPPRRWPRRCNRPT